jgi:hypothetical protein
LTRVSEDAGRSFEGQGTSRVVLLAAAMVALPTVAVQSVRAVDAADASMTQKQAEARTGKFEGVKANNGFATLSHDAEGRATLTYSDDFTVPNTPAPSWQVVDSKGNVYLLNQLRIKGDKYNKSIVLPAYVRDVVKVQIWCSFAEVLLGEASFPQAVAANN